MKWRRLNGDRIERPILEAIEETLIREIKAGHKLKVCIGTDSQSKGGIIDFATVIVFLREGKGGFMYITDMQKKDTMSLKERMIIEVSYSVQVAYSMCDLLDRYNIELEVHADINTDPTFKSNVALKEAMGYILGMGFQFKAKPDSFASSTCADRIVH